MQDNLKCKDCMYFAKISYNDKICGVCQISSECQDISHDATMGACCLYEKKTDFYHDAETVPVVTERAEAVHDAVNSPSHYCQGGIECIEALKAATVNLKGIEAVCTANAIKYLWRWKEKNGATDIRKCIWYCERLLKEIENGD